MRVALLNAYDPYSFRGGAETFSLAIKDTLTEIGARVDLLYPELFGISEDKYSYRFAVEVIKVKKDYDLFISNPIISHYLLGEDINLVNVYHMCFREMAQSCKGGIPTTTYLSWRHIVSSLEHVSGLIGRNLAVSSFVKTSLQKHYQLKGVRVLNHFIDTKTFRPMDRAKLRGEYSIPPEAVVGLYIGRNDYTKGYDIFKEVYRLTRDRVFWIQVLSSGGLQQYEPIPIKTFKGVEYEEMPKVYNLADFLFFPSRYEGFGLVVLEALACGVPAVASDTGICKEMGGAWEDLKIDTADFEGAVLGSLRKIRLLSENPNLCRFLGRWGREQVLRRFNLKRWKKKLTEVLGL